MQISCPAAFMAPAQQERQPRVLQVAYWIAEKYFAWIMFARSAKILGGTAKFCEDGNRNQQKQLKVCVGKTVAGTLQRSNRALCSP